MKWPEGMIAPDKELELNKQTDQVLDSLINFYLTIGQTYF